MMYEIKPYSEEYENESHRGNGIGKKLMQCLQVDYPDHPVYVMSGNDEYYQKIGAKREGSIYLFS